MRLDMGTLARLPAATKIFVAGYLAFLLVSAITPCAPSDAELRTRYEAHLASFDELVELAYSEARFIVINYSHASSFQIALTERLAAHPRARALLAEVGEPFVRIRPTLRADQFQLWFQYDVRSRVPAFYAARGLAFVPETIPFTDEDTVAVSTRPHRSAGAKVSYLYVPLRGNWYIYEEVVNLLRAGYWFGNVLLARRGAR